MASRGLLRSSLLVVALTSVLFSFQNCSKPNGKASSTSGSTNKNLEMGGNGAGYDGKVFVSRGVCGTDEQGLKSAVELSPDGQQALLLREECQKIDPKPLVAGEYQLASNEMGGAVLTFNGAVFQAEDHSVLEQPTEQDVPQVQPQQPRKKDFTRPKARQSGRSVASTGAKSRRPR